MDKSIIDKMNKEEILELLSPYLSRGESASQYYEMLKSSYPRIKLEDDVRYPKGRIDIWATNLSRKAQIDISINMVDLTGVNKWDDIGSVGLSIYPDIVAKYRDMIINKIIQ
jgi:hypothetical protein